MRVVYKGLSKEQIERSIEAQMAIKRPTERRGYEYQYTISRSDHPDVVAKKRARLKAWLGEQRKEIEEDIAGIAAGTTIWGVEFKAGVAVDVPDSHKLVREGKLAGLIEDGSFDLAAEAKGADGDEDKPKRKAKAKKAETESW